MHNIQSFDAYPCDHGHFLCLHHLSIPSSAIPGGGAKFDATSSYACDFNPKELPTHEIQLTASRPINSCKFEGKSSYAVSLLHLSTECLQCSASNLTLLSATCQITPISGIEQILIMTDRIDSKRMILSWFFTAWSEHFSCFLRSACHAVLGYLIKFK